jgi:hydrogenase small subunit
MFNVKVTRRQFLKWLTASAAVLGLSQTELLRIENALAAGPTPDPNMPLGTLLRVVWITGADCGGCATTLLNYLADPGDPELVLGAIANNAIPTLEGSLVDLNALYPGQDGADIDIAEVVLEIVTIDWGYIVMAASGDVANNHLVALRNEGGYALMFDGAILTAANGQYCSTMDIPGHIAGVGNPWSDYMEEYVTTENTNGIPAGQQRTAVTMAGATLWLAQNAAAVVCLGTCATWGGVPAAKGSVTGAKSGWDWINNINGMGKVLVNVPGCPPNPDWFIATVGAAILELTGIVPGLLTGNLVMDLDHKNRPKLAYKGVGASMYSAERIFCSDCPRINSATRPTKLTKVQKSAATPDGSCMSSAGCMGYLNFAAHLRADCPTRKWNNFEDHSKNNWCVGNNMPCQGCTDPGFPDTNSPFYKKNKGF